MREIKEELTNEKNALEHKAKVDESNNVKVEE